MLLLTITFTAQRQICRDAIVLAANPIRPPLASLVLGIFHLQKQGDSVLIFIPWLLSINLAPSVWWVFMERDVCRCKLLYNILFHSCGILGLDVIKIGAFCYCLFTEAVCIGSWRRDLFKSGVIVVVIIVGQRGQCTIKAFQNTQL